MKIPPHADYIGHGQNHHLMRTYEPNEEMKVIEKLDCFWGGTPIPAYDLTRIAYNSTRRLTNFLPQAPYGNIAVVPATTTVSDTGLFKNILLTDGRYWYDKNNLAHEASEYMSTVVQAFEEAADRLPLRVSGEVSWVAVEIKPGLIRLLLLDPGYLDPAERQATVHIKHLPPLKAADILNNTEFAIADSQFSLTVPMGTLRIVDLISYPYVYAGNDTTIEEGSADSLRLRGIVDDPEPLSSFVWEKIEGPECTYYSADSLKLVISNAMAGEYTFRLNVEDVEGNKGFDELKLKVICTSCLTPEVSAGPDLKLRLPADTIRINGSILHDGEGLQFLSWEKISGPAIQLINDDSLNLSLSPSKNGTYQFRLVAKSLAGFLHSDTMQLILLPELNEPDTIPFITDLIQVDGIKDELWGPPLEINKLVFGYFDTESTASMLWNNESLCFFLNVEDKFLWNDSGNNWWDDDVAEVLIDAGSEECDTFDQNDFRFGFSLVDQSIFETKNRFTGIDHSLVSGTEYQQLEFCIPWNLLGVVPEINHKMGLEIRVIDDYNANFADAIEAKYGFSGQDSPMPEEFGKVVLGASLNSNTGSKFRTSGFHVYPATTQGKIQVLFEGNVDNTILYMTNALGSVVLQSGFLNSAELDISSLPSGTYIIFLKNGHDRKKVLKF